MWCSSTKAAPAGMARQLVRGLRAGTCPRFRWRASSTSATRRTRRSFRKLMHEMHDPANCAKVLPDLVGLCDVHLRQPLLQRRQQEERNHAGLRHTSIPVSACSTSATRCGPRRSRITTRRAPLPEPGLEPHPPGSWVAGGPDWCSAQVHLDAEAGTLWTTCQDNGFFAQVHAWRVAVPRAGLRRGCRTDRRPRDECQAATAWCS